MKKINFVIFGDIKNFYGLALEMSKEIETKYNNSKVFLYNETHLPEDLLHIANKYPEGFGKWLWKPHLIRRVMNLTEDESLVFYLDSRFKIPNKLPEYVSDFASGDSDALIYQSPLPEREWTSSYLFDYFNTEINSLIATSGQIAGGIVLLKNNNKTKRLVDLWYLSLLDTIDILTKQNEMNKNPFFKLHRTDQSVLSLIVKINQDNLKIYAIDRTQIFNYNSFIPHFKKSPVLFSEKASYRVLPKWAKPLLRWFYSRSKILKWISNLLP
jgi:hypothetical protein